jgi:molybdopterin molybdotransferase
MGFKESVSRKEALDCILQSIRPLEPITLALDKALGYVLAQDIYASQNVPSSDRAAMDGYALSSQDTVSATKGHPVRLVVSGEIHPSTAEPVSVETGYAVRIMTGGPIPPGADAVVRQEDVLVNREAIEIAAPAPCARFVSKKGKDIQKGTLVAGKGTVIEPAHIGILATLHVREVVVTRRPEVGILAIGNELLDLKAHPENPKIVASNLYMLSAMIQSQGSTVGFSAITNNRNEAIRKDLEKALKKDMVITIGGTAHSDSDLTRAAIEAAGVRIQFAGIAMLPGKGTAFGLYGNKPIFALPGTPSAAFTAFHVLVLPALRRLSGLQKPGLNTTTALLEKDIKKNAAIERAIQGIVSHRGACVQVLPLVGPEPTGMLAMAKANGLIMVPPNSGCLSAGRPVSVQLLDYGKPGFLYERALLNHEKSAEPPFTIISIVGKSDAGKTTFLEKLIHELKSRGCKIGTIKHDVHGFDIDHKGKDSWRHKQAGAHTVIISSPKKIAVIKDVDKEETIDNLAGKYFQGMDLILTEGYKRQDKPKIEIFRSTVHAAPLCKDDTSLIAIVSDMPLNLGVPCFGLDDIKAIADFVEIRFLKTQRHS